MKHVRGPLEPISDPLQKKILAVRSKLGALCALMVRSLTKQLMACRKALKRRLLAPVHDGLAAREIGRSGLFDTSWYLRRYSDVAASGMHPIRHYLTCGAKEGRDPSPSFSALGYLSFNPDVAAAGVNPLLHFLRYGAAEGRVGHAAGHLSADRVQNGLADHLAESGSFRSVDYTAWQSARLASRLAADPRSDVWNHLITIVIFVAESGQSIGLRATLASLRQQRYRNIELLVAGPVSALPADLADFSEHRGLFFEPGLDSLGILSSPANDRLWRGTHVMFARAGTEFAPDAFALLNAALSRELGDCVPELVLCDYDRLSASGDLVLPSFVPGWDPDLICDLDYVETAFLASRALVLAQRQAPPPISLHDWLRGIAVGLRQPATTHVAEPLVHMPASAPRPSPEKMAPAPFLIESTTELPAMAIVIPNRNQAELLRRCVNFLEFPNRFRTELVIVDNASDEPALDAIYSELRARHGARIVQMNQSFNFSRMVNLGVAEVSAEVVLLLNNDVEITTPGLLEQMLAHAQRKEVGVVGSKLLYPDGTLQHAGMLLRSAPTSECAVWGGHVMRGAARSAHGYLYQLSTVRNYQCVTGALQAFRRDVFEHVGGFDEVALPIEFNDVDFCLRVRHAGWRVIALPLDGIIHAESSTRRTADKQTVMQMRAAAIAVIAQRWPDAVARDPFRNPWVEVGEVAEPRFPWSIEAT